ncbi:hypothetical protein UA08_08262 [Talaromyces atroroseus]|uniref:Uncharacterized protein n=1 Tax=Talaromyces atroroseus TaxID=1441469 RepID=A0A225ASU8_TALAT|nr:hypothetical protein UA08_08262 [Talaromyces atroroseus]OKL56527.1 hypothetical protein UA08_08262 [Talaromyces atroroseus]
MAVAARVADTRPTPNFISVMSRTREALPRLLRGISDEYEVNLIGGYGISRIDRKHSSSKSSDPYERSITFGSATTESDEQNERKAPTAASAYPTYTYRATPRWLQEAELILELGAAALAMQPLVGNNTIDLCQSVSDLPLGQYATQNMDKLPIEVLRLICGYVQADDHEDFSSWTLVNHCFHEVAVPFIYETLNVRFSDYTSLQHIVTEIKENPRRKQFLTHARRLNIMAMPDNGYQEVFDLDSLRGSYNIFGLDEDLRARDLIPDTFGSPGFFFNRHLSEPLIQTLRAWREPGYYNEKNWEPLIWLIGSMSRLTEMNYLLKNMFPKCLLEVIHKHHLTCQLNVWGRQWLQLREPGLEGFLSTPNVVPELRDPFEMDLLRSPCLHALLINYNVYRLAKTQVAVENIFPLITMAPNLKHIDLTEGAVSEMNDITKYNQSLDEYVSKSKFLASPISLRHQGYCFDSLKEWAKSTDFSSLRAFEFPNSYFPLEILNQLSKFPQLDYLHLGLQSPFGMAQDPSFARDLSSLFAGLNPLKYIRVCCPQDTAIIHEIFAHHGRTLRGFIIEPYMPPGRKAHEKHPLYPLFSTFDLVSLSRQAPHLEEFRLPLRRSLDLDCNFRESIARDYNQFSEQNAELPTRDVFINAAMDETLGKAIWDRIDLSGGGKRLRNLRISILGVSSLRRAEGEIARRLARQFLITRSMSYVGGHMKIREIGQGRIESQTARQLEYDQDEVFELPKRVQEIVFSLWPSETEQFTWDFEWKSFPLQVELALDS